MTTLQRVAGVLLLLALIIAPSMTIAQDDDADTDDESLRVVGSGIVGEVFETLTAASDVDLDVNLEITGTERGFAEFCAGEAGITLATRPLSADEETACIENEIDYGEFLIGHNILAVVAHPELDFVTCLDYTALNAILAPSASGVITDWTQLDMAVAEMPAETPLSIFTPPENTAVYTLVDNLIDGVLLRADATVTEDYAAVLDAVSSTPGAIGFVTLQAAQQNEDVRIIEISASAEGGCQVPSAENVERLRYTEANRLFVYARQDILEQPGVNQFMTFVTGADAADVVAEAGFTPPTEDAYAQNEAVLTGEESGRQFSLDVVAFEIPPSVSGTVTIEGAAHLNGFFTNLSTSFTETYAGVQSVLTFLGEPAGARSLCNGEIDMLVTYDGLTEEQVENCAANNIETIEIDLGVQAVVILANAENEEMSCLAREELLTIWGSSSEENPTMWNEIDDRFPETPMTLFAPENGTSYTDLLLRPQEGPVLPLRDDAERNNDPLYRAAATANVDGGLTYMSWPEYLRVLDNDQDNIQLVRIGDCDDPTLPTTETILSGEYPLAWSATLVISQQSLANIQVQSLIWYMLSDAGFEVYENTGFIGLTLDDLPALRNDLQEQFAEAQAAALEVGPEATPEATAEATSEATAEATPDPDEEE